METPDPAAGSLAAEVVAVDVNDDDDSDRCRGVHSKYAPGLLNDKSNPILHEYGH